MWDTSDITPIKIAEGTTDESGEAGFVVDPGKSYIVCFETATPPDPTNCFATGVVSVGEIIVVNVTQDDMSEEWALTGEGVDTKPAEDNIALLEERVTVCHNYDKKNPDNKKPREITVNQSAVPAHLAHGDVVGPCPDPAVSTASITEETGDDGG